jgi:CheY-like chemotaxis protein
LVVEADRYQIEQVLLNIFLNASHAMPDGGDLHLSTEEVAISDNESALLDIQPGRYTQISITDTGIGMDETVRRRIFEPFFTTKEKDRGTGLGLASAYGIIKNHDGTITVESDVGQGTTFNIYLPLSDKTPEQAASVKGPVMKGSETVMLVDDEEMILQVNAAIMKKLGYRVILARGGEQAINEVQKNGAEIDLVILDMIMPGINGGKTFDCIRVIQPSIPVILSSGYAIDGDASDILSRGCNGFIQKPFRVEDISRKIRLVLDEAKSDADIAAST